MSTVSIEAIPAVWVRSHYWIQFNSREDRDYRLFLPIQNIVRSDYHLVFEPADMVTFSPRKVQTRDIIPYQNLFPFAKRTREASAS